MVPSSPRAGPCSPGMLRVSLWAEQQVGALAQIGCSSAALEGACCFQPPAAKWGPNLRSSSLTEQKKLIVVMTFFRKELSCLHLPQANQLSVLFSFVFSPVPLSLVHSLRIEETLYFGIFFSPHLFSFCIESCLLVVEDRGLLHLFLPFTFPCAKLRLKCCRFLQTLNLEQASDPTEFCGTWVLQILPVLELWQHQSPSFSWRRSALTLNADSSGASHLSLHFPSLGIQSEGGNFF